MKFPRRWASDDLYTSGTSNGLPSKVDPGAAAALQGFVPGISPFSPAQLNYLLNELADVARFAIGAHLSSYEVCSLDDAPPTTTGMAAVYDAASDTVLLCKGGVNGTHVIQDDGSGDTVADSGTVTSVRDGAIDPIAGTTVVVGLGGAFAARSTNLGGSWSDASTPPTAKDSVVWDATNGLFLAGRVGVATIHTSPTGAVWTSRAITGTANSRVAVTTGGLGLIGRGATGTIAFDRSTNGTTWTNTGTTLPDLANIKLASAPTVCALGATLYCAAVFSPSGVDALRIHTSTDGLTWTLLASLPVGTASGQPTLSADPYSGALYVNIPVSAGNNKLYASADGGTTWFGPATLRLAAGNTRAAAGGRLWTNLSATTRMSAMRLPAAV